jgi:hypothetical protein
MPADVGDGEPSERERVWKTLPADEGKNAALAVRKDAAAAIEHLLARFAAGLMTAMCGWSSR